MVKKSAFTLQTFCKSLKRKLNCDMEKTLNLKSILIEMVAGGANFGFLYLFYFNLFFSESIACKERFLIIIIATYVRRNLIYILYLYRI